MRWKPKTETAAACVIATMLGACGGSAMPSRASTAMYPAPSVDYASGSAATASTESMPMAEPASAPAAAMSRPGMAASAPMRQMAAHVPLPAPGGGAAREGNAGHESPTTNVSAEAAPMLIYTASVAMTVERPTESIDQAVEIVSAIGGFLAQRNDAMVQVRVPSARFQKCSHDWSGSVT